MKTTKRDRAPKGGITIKGKFYRGGCFLPKPRVETMGSAARVTKAPTKFGRGKAGRMARLRWVEEATGVSFTDRVVNHVAMYDAGSSAYYAKLNGTSCQSSKARFVKTFRRHVLDGIREERYGKNVVKHVLAGLKEEDRGDVSYAEFMSMIEG